MRATRMRGGVPPSASDCAPHQVRVPLEEYSGEVQSRATWPTHVPGWWDPDMQPIRRQVKRKPLAICSQSARNLLAICSQSAQEDVPLI